MSSYSDYEIEHHTIHISEEDSHLEYLFKLKQLNVINEDDDSVWGEILHWPEYNDVDFMAFYPTDIDFTDDYEFENMLESIAPSKMCVCNETCIFPNGNTYYLRCICTTHA